MAGLSLKILGPVQATLDGKPVPGLRTSKVQALLIYLAVERVAHRREHLMTLLWPGMPEKSARHNLRQVLYQLRKAIPEVPAKQGGADAEAEDSVPLLLSDRQAIQLNPAAEIEIDLELFAPLLAETKTHFHANLTCCAACQAALEKAVVLYRGEFLADFYLEDSAQFEDWAAVRRELYRRQALRGLESLAEICLQKKEYEQARGYAARQLAIDNLRESAHRQRMEILALQGQRVAALRQYGELCALLRRELDVAPTAETEALAEAIRAELVVGEEASISDGAVVARPSETVMREERRAEPPPGSIAGEPEQIPVPHNLPPQPTAFVGREQELVGLGALIADPEARLVTIVGPGGMGKTRLALAAAVRQVEPDGRDPAFPDGVYFVSLAPINTADQLVNAVAAYVNFQLQTNPHDPRTPPQQMIDFLRRKRLLLVLDNFEQLLADSPDATDLLVEIWRAAPQVQLLVTSRERLNLQMEQVFPLGGLPVPEENTPAAETDYDAVRLFQQAARGAQPSFQLTGQAERRALADLCRLVGGMPLALELAAGWVDVLSLAEIAAEIQGSLDFLETELRDVPARHRRMRAIFDTTWGQLTVEEREALARFSVFRGGCTREAAQEVSGASLRTLARLADKSLLQFHRAAGRYQIHTLLQTYAAEKLSQDSAVKTAVQESHCAFYCTALEKWKTILISPRQATALAEITADYDNIRLAWEWAVARDQLAYLLVSIDALGEYFYSSHPGFETPKVFTDAAGSLRTRYGSSPTSAEAARLLARLWARRGFYVLSATDYYFDVQAEESYRQGLALLDSQALEDEDTRSEAASIRLRLGNFLTHPGFEKDIVEGRRHLETSLQLYRELGDAVGMGDVLNALAYCSYREGKVEQCMPFLTECLTLQQQLGDPRRLAWTLVMLGEYKRYHLLAYEEAFAAYTQAYEVLITGGGIYGIQDIQGRIAWLSCFLGKFDLALAVFKGLVTFYQSAGHQYLAAIYQIQSGLTQAYHGRYLVAESLIRDGIATDPRTDNELTKSYLALVLIHRGRYETGRELARKADLQSWGWGLRLQSWMALVKNAHSESLVYAQKSVEISRQLFTDREWRAWAQAPMGLALHGLGRGDEARHVLHESLQTCVEIRAFIPLMHLMPVLPVVLAESADQDLKTRAVELYAMAESLPFVGNSQLFADIAGKPMAAVADTLPPEVVNAVRARGRQLDWWEAAEALLKELDELGWSAPAEQPEEEG